ncbi:peptide/nickel transport system ATP-binding protein [Salegentibacter echinorum]|uniref:Peptide/nickel transport system ATP-binding protein n=1 Tax=Salegentibacter echinorum TaxID=1073325 RepID=A0A1M5K4P2_SALEC|nr:ATP-binding cassette domain-containing protein [Salegentibacter echinorum]SHG47746.1 peptide/nickel transport system ATP-binding protein [Salegentibacter echinorum]
MLKIQETSYRYQRERQLFEGLNLTVKPGEIVGLYGNSGMGKTTMAKIIAGYLNPDSGKITVDDQNHHKKSPNPVQLIWQHPEQAVNPRWKMKQVLAEGGVIQKELYEQFDIKESWMQRYPSELSGGELQRFCLARALMPTTKYIIADEITTMLDALTQAQIWRVMLSLKTQRQLGILAISHDKILLDRISDRVINFEDLIKSPS